jgi:hypothetical protein
MTDPVPMPPFAYVPGQTPRHREGAFGTLQDSVRANMSPTELIGTQAWLAGLQYLEQGFYWEAHEVLEPVWMQTGQNSAERQMVQAIIQIANAALKQRMNRPRAVVRLCELAQGHLHAAQTRGGDWVMGLKCAEIAQRIAEIRSSANPDPWRD